MMTEQELEQLIAVDPTQPPVGEPSTGLPVTEFHQEVTEEELPPI